VTLVRIFSCFHDRDHVHPHIHANSYTKSYAKHAIHTPKINTPKFKEISLLVILQKERGVIEQKIICSRSIEKCAPIKEHRKKRKRKHDPPPKIKARGESQSKESLEKTQKYNPHTCTYRSSCMTSFFLDPVLGSTISCGTSETHTYPTQSSTYKPYK
jgi:hypothetical protein